MKITIVLVAMIGVSIAAHVPTLQRAEIHDQHGQFALNYATADGVSVAQQGALKTSPDGETRVLVVQGSYEYTDANGQKHKTSYIADENGYRLVGDQVPAIH